MLKTCTKCSSELPLSGFHNDKNRKDGRNPWCKPCARANATRYHHHGPLDPSQRRKSRPKMSAEEKAEKNRRNVARNRMENVYGITWERYEEMYTAQGGKCLICSEQKDRLAVDHCHSSGRVRGLLCRNCNVAIGMLGDNPDLVRRALLYLAPGTWS